MMVFSPSVVSDSETPWPVALQAPLSMGFPQTRILEWGAIGFSVLLARVEQKKKRNDTLLVHMGS